MTGDSDHDVLMTSVAGDRRGSILLAYYVEQFLINFVITKYLDIRQSAHVYTFAIDVFLALHSCSKCSTAWSIFARYSNYTNENRIRTA